MPRGSGRWRSATFSAELLARGTTARLRHGKFVVLADLRTLAIQPAAVVDAVEAMMPAALKIIASAPIALVVSSSLAKTQAKRDLRAASYQTFYDIDEARSWLAAEQRLAT